MIRTLSEYSALKPLSLLLVTLQRKKTEYIPLAHFSMLVRINPGRSVSVLPGILQSSLKPSERTSQTTI
jgi:hypothetical protein